MTKRARFEEGVPADPTQNMSPEDKAIWEEMNQEYGDQFKTASNQEVARMILQQLGGGNRLRAMLGKDLILSAETFEGMPALVMSFPQQKTSRPNHVTIAYNEMLDSYTVVFRRNFWHAVRGQDKMVNEADYRVEDVYGDMLSNLITEKTGKALRLAQKEQSRQAAAVMAWSPDFISATEAMAKGDAGYRYVRYEDLRLLEKEWVREMWEPLAAPYAFVHEHYYYPVSDAGLERAPRVLAIPEDKLDDDAYMESLGYKKAPVWVPEPEKPESPFEEVLRMASTFSSSPENQIAALANSMHARGRQAAEAPSFSVRVMDADNGLQEWAGPASKLIEDNDGDEEVVDALGKLKKPGDKVLVGGGADARFTLVRI